MTETVQDLYLVLVFCANKVNYDLYYQYIMIQIEEYSI